MEMYKCCMTKTQIQLPDPLYQEVKRVAQEQDWSLAEVLRRGAEYIVKCYPKRETDRAAWALPAPRDLGAINLPYQEWRELATDRAVLECKGG